MELSFTQVTRRVFSDGLRGVSRAARGTEDSFLSKTSGELQVSPCEILAEWRSFFGSLSSTVTHTDAFPVRRELTDLPGLNGTISSEELEEALMSQRNGKAAGADVP